MSRGLLAAALGAALLAGCASAPRSPSLYQQLGGEAGVTAIVEGLLFKIVDNPRIAHHFAETDIIQLRDRLVEQVCAEADGPCTYTGRSMAESHAGRNITEAEFNALVEDLIDVMEEQHVPVTAQNRLLRKLAPMRADIIRR